MIRRIWNAILLKVIDFLIPDVDYKLPGFKTKVEIEEFLHEQDQLALKAMQEARMNTEEVEVLGRLLRGEIEDKQELDDIVLSISERLYEEPRKIVLGGIYKIRHDFANLGPEEYHELQNQLLQSVINWNTTIVSDFQRRVQHIQMVLTAENHVPTHFVPGVIEE